MTTTRSPRTIVSVTILAFLVVAALLQALLRTEGAVGRAFFLLACCAVAYATRALLRTSGGWPATTPVAQRFAVALVVAGIAWHTFIGINSTWATHQTGIIWNDQGQCILRSYHLIARGYSPYGQGVMDDYVEYENAVSTWFHHPCVHFGNLDLQKVLVDYWATLDPEVMSLLVPDIDERPECNAARRAFNSVGFRYGPTMTLAHAPAIALMGPAGVPFTNTWVFLVLCSAMWWLMRRVLGADAVLSSLPLSLLLIPSNLRESFLSFICGDITAVALAVLFMGAWFSRRHIAAPLLLGLCITSKLLPGLLFAPWLLPLGLRRGALLLVPIVLLFGPFYAWDAVGFVTNMFIWPMHKPVRSDALAYVLDPVAHKVLVALLVALVGAAVVRAQRRKWDADAALVCGVVAHAGALLSGQGFQNNYVLWIVPLLGFYMAHPDTRTAREESAIDGAQP